MTISMVSRGVPLAVRLVVVCLVGALHPGPGYPSATATELPSTAGALRAVDVATKARVEDGFGKMPLYFVENRGQMDPQVGYYVQGTQTAVYFTTSGITFSLRGDADGAAEQQKRQVLKLDFVDANRQARPVGRDRIDTAVSYFKGPRNTWKTGLGTYATLVYEELWPGIDLVYTGTASQLKYEFRVKAGADPERIKLAYRGTTEVSLTEAGRLRVTAGEAVMEDERPVSYQDQDGPRVAVESAFALSSRTEGERREYGFTVGAYDKGKTLVIDPATLVFAGFIGGDNNNGANSAIAVDSVGNAYVTGYTSSSEETFPVTVGPDLATNGGFDAFVAKVNSMGTALDYAGYIGGAGLDYGLRIAVDNLGNAYVTGGTESTEQTFPVTVGPDLTHNGGGLDGFVAKINATGTALMYAGYIGGDEYDDCTGIAVDATGNAYVTGDTGSTEATFPVTVGPDLTYNGNGDGFVAKVNAAGTALDYAGYIGGEMHERFNAIEVDGSGNAYLTGSTSSTEATFPVTVGPDLSFNGDSFPFTDYDAFVAKVNAAGTALVYAGYIGGAGPDEGDGIAVDESGNAYVTGYTEGSTTFPVAVGPYLTYAYREGNPAFVVKVNAAGTALVYAGFIGGHGYNEGKGIAVDSSGNAYVAGYTTASETTFPVNIGPDLTFNGHGIFPNVDNDAFVAKVSAAGTSLVYAGYIGGAGDDYGWGIAVDGSGNAYITGYTSSTETTFPVLIGPDVTFNGGGQTFVAKVSAYDGLPRATVGVAYSAQVEPSDGTGPYTFSIVAGALPAGLTLDANGTIAGTPTAAGLASFTVRVMDSVGSSVDQDLAICVGIDVTNVKFNASSRKLDITSASFDGSIPLVQILVEVNGVVVSPPQRAKYKVAKSLLRVSGSKNQLNIQQGVNTVVVIVDSCRAAPFAFTF